MKHGCNLPFRTRRTSTCPCTPARHSGSSSPPTSGTSTSRRSSHTSPGWTSGTNRSILVQTVISPNPLFSRELCACCALHAIISTRLVRTSWSRRCWTSTWWCILRPSSGSPAPSVRRRIQPSTAHPTKISEIIWRYSYGSNHYWLIQFVFEQSLGWI